MEVITVTDVSGMYTEIVTGFDAASFTHEWAENETWQIDFDIAKSEHNAFAFDLIKEEHTICFQNQAFVIKKVIYGANAAQLYKKVTAFHISNTMQDGFQYDEKTGTLSVLACLDFIFSGESGSMGFTYTLYDPNKVVETVQQENFGNGNYLKLVQEMLEDYKLVMVADNKHLSFYPVEDYGAYTENQIRYNLNLDGVTMEVDTTAFRTQIRGYGKKKEDDTYYFAPITYTSPLANQYGIRIQDPVSDERYTVKGNLERRLKDDLQDYPATTITVNTKLAVPVTRGDYVIFVYEPMQLNYDVRVVGITEYPFTTKPPTVTLSNTKKNIVQILARYLTKEVAR
ncbi:hypothetical protein HCJ66_11455 [Listeria sp. FSL L7-1582]|uniref:phage tail protein n=1 Tax=Listeria portnoyi TaxID=2713504 RepID=UPI00164E89DA|nr:phage tail protein [Listeria portnoyi]MBC6310154.1 hypothetical protein [Listeria portnoyi]